MQSSDCVVCHPMQARSNDERPPPAVKSCPWRRPPYLKRCGKIQTAADPSATGAAGRFPLAPG
eukprot:8442493-Pyramimonas_sp.AAC.1